MGSRREHTEGRLTRKGEAYKERRSLQGKARLTRKGEAYKERRGKASKAKQSKAK